MAMLSKATQRLLGAGSNNSKKKLRNDKDNGKEARLRKLITQDRWEEVLEFLSLNQENSIHRTHGTTSRSYDQASNGNALHIICQKQICLADDSDVDSNLILCVKVIKTLLTLFPLLSVQVDTDKRTPLHVAAMNGASSKVLSTLLTYGGTSPGVMQDIHGRTPFHLYLLHQGGAWLTDSGRPRSSPKPCKVDIKVLRILSESVPLSISMLDQVSEQSPLQLVKHLVELQKEQKTSFVDSIAIGLQIIKAMEKTERMGQGLGESLGQASRAQRARSFCLCESLANDELSVSKPSRSSRSSIVDHSEGSVSNLSRGSLENDRQKSKKKTMGIGDAAFASAEAHLMRIEQSEKNQLNDSRRGTSPPEIHYQKRLTSSSA